MTPTIGAFSYQSGDDENSAQDMAAFVGRASAIARETGACVLAIHHPGKDDARGMRGSSALFAACDAVIKIAEQDDSTRLVTLEKVKDGPLGGLFSYTLRQVDLGTDEDGDKITSCVVVEAGLGSQGKRGRPRKIDGDAFNRLKGNKTVVELNDTEKAAWGEVFKKVRNALKAEGKIRADVFDDVQSAAQ